jgi:hypothetical protein
MPSDTYAPRFGFEISQAQQARASKVLGQFGIRKVLFNLILDDVLDLIEKHGDPFIAALASGMVKPREVIPAINRAERLAEEINNGRK